MDFTPLGDQLAVCGNTSFTIYNISSTLSMVGYSSASTVAQLADCQFTSDIKLMVALSNGSVLYYSGAVTATASTPLTYSGTLSCIANRLDNISNPYHYITGSDTNSMYYVSSNTTSILPANSGGGALTCSYSKALDWFVFGGSKMLLLFFNGAAMNNSLTFQYNLSQIITSSDFSDDGNYLVVGTVGSVFIYTQKCNGCDSSFFLN
jgi:hypothetical protein